MRVEVSPLSFSRSSSGTALTVKVSAFHGHRDHARPTHSRPGSAPRFPPRSRRERGRAVPIRGRVLCSSSWRVIVARKFSATLASLHRGPGRVSYLRQDHLGGVYAFRTPHPVHRSDTHIYIYMIFYDNGPCPIAVSLPYCVSVAWTHQRRSVKPVARAIALKLVDRLSFAHFAGILILGICRGIGKMTNCVASIRVVVCIPSPILAHLYPPLGLRFHGDQRRLVL